MEQSDDSFDKLRQGDEIRKLDERIKELEALLRYWKWRALELGAVEFNGVFTKEE